MNILIYWKQTANDSWETVEYLYNGKRYAESLFLFFLAVEKWLKAHWVKHNVNNYPARIHDLHSLYAETNLELEADQLDFEKLKFLKNVYSKIFEHFA